ncbi:MAG: succinylglutamate desuccinylase/aspartoacylase family protein [Spirochaetia bacterium]
MKEETLTAILFPSMKMHLRRIHVPPEGWRARLQKGLGLARHAARPRPRLVIICAAVLLGVAGLSAGISIAIAAVSKHEASAWPGADFTFWPERSWRQVERRISSLPAVPRMESTVIGEVSYRGSSYPVHLLRFPSLRGGRHGLRVFLASGVHGTESAGVEALLQLSEEMARNPQLLPQVAFDIVPVVNPWGWTYGYRYDGEGEDVNRDFSSRRTQEARILRSFIDRNGPYDLVLDLHESKKYGYFIYQYLPAAQGLGSEYVRMLGRMGKPRENAYREGIYAAVNGILSMPVSALPWVALGGRLSLEQYTRLHGTRHSYTVETPLHDDFNERVAVHRETVSLFMDRLLRGEAGR